MYVSPETWAKMVHDRKEHMNVGEWNAMEMELHPDKPAVIAEGEGVAISSKF